MILTATSNKNELHYDYKIGGFLVRIIGEGSDMRNVDGFQPFQLHEVSDEVPILRFITNSEIDESLIPNVNELYHFDWEIDNMKSNFYKHKNGYCFTMEIPGEKPYIMWHENDNPIVRTNLAANGRMPNPTRLRHMLWTALGLVIAKHKAIAIHSSTLEYKGKAVMCLGESGTGKSTHTHLWYKNIKNVSILNDDCPILKVEDNEIVTYGSPWSGKTPYYRPERFSVAAIIRIVRAPYNKIDLQNTLESFSAIQPSCPPAFAYDETLSDYMYSTLSDIIQRVPTYCMYCLPNAEAAHVAFDTIFGNK